MEKKNHVNNKKFYLFSWEKKVKKTLFNAIFCMMQKRKLCTVSSALFYQEQELRVVNPASVWSDSVVCAGRPLEATRETFRVYKVLPDYLMVLMVLNVLKSRGLQLLRCVSSQLHHLCVCVCWCCHPHHHGDVQRADDLRTDVCLFTVVPQGPGEISMFLKWVPGICVVIGRIVQVSGDLLGMFSNETWRYLKRLVGPWRGTNVFRVLLSGSAGILEGALWILAGTAGLRGSTSP